MKSTNVLMVIAVLAVGLAMFNLIITVNKVQDVEKLTGFAVTDTADVNLSVASNLLINFTTDSVDWGTGYVTPGAGNADLYTNGTIVGGSWSAVSSPLVIENAGNENANSMKENNELKEKLATMEKRLDKYESMMLAILNDLPRNKMVNIEQLMSDDAQKSVH